MASSSDPWIRDLNEASKLADDISSMISERSSLPSGPDAQRHLSAIRRKILILGTKLDSLESLLSKLPSKQNITGKELNKRKDMLANVRSKTKQMASALNMSNFANREDLLGESKRSEETANRIAGLDNRGIVGLQRQIMREQDEGLEKLEETVLSTKHIALAVNEELDLHSRLIDDLDQHVEITDSRLQRVQKRLAILNKRTKGGCSCMCMLFSVLAIVILAAIVWSLIKYFACEVNISSSRSLSRHSLMKGSGNQDSYSQRKSLSNYMMLLVKILINVTSALQYQLSIYAVFDICMECVCYVHMFSVALLTWQQSNSCSHVIHVLFQNRILKSFLCHDALLFSAQIIVTKRT